MLPNYLIFWLAWTDWLSQLKIQNCGSNEWYTSPTWIEFSLNVDPSCLLKVHTINIQIKYLFQNSNLVGFMNFLKNLYPMFIQVKAISCPPLDQEIAWFGGLFWIQGLLGRQISVQPKFKQIFKIVCQTQQTCDSVSDKKWLRL